MKRILIVLTIGFLISSCAKQYYIASDFEMKTMGHQEIAVLPVEMIFTGRMPENITEEEIAEIEEGESKAFMISVFDAILESTKNERKPLRIDVQSFNQTISMLDKQNISLRESWNMSAPDLAEILGVDAVVRSRIYKKRYMSDLASYGISTGIRVVQILTGGALGGFIPGDVNKTSDIKANFTLIHGVDGSVLYSKAFTEETDWNDPTEEIIRKVTRRFAKHFPYRIKR